MCWNQAEEGLLEPAGPLSPQISNIKMVLRGNFRFCPLRGLPVSRLKCPPFRGDRALDRFEPTDVRFEGRVQLVAATHSANLSAGV